MVKQRGNKTVAQCPACAETGGDKKGVHLVLYPSGKFGCAANPNDKAHRRHIAELVGDPTCQPQPWTLKLRGKVVMIGGATASLPITSLSRAAVKLCGPSAKQPSEVSINTVSDVSDAVLVHRQYTYSDKIGTGVVQGDEHIAGVYADRASVPSVDIVPHAIAIFDGKATTFTPGAPIPNRFADVLRTWTAARGSPLNLPPPRPRVAAWTKRGQPIYAKH